MQQAGIGLTVVSNALPSRVAPFAEKIGLRYTAFSCKPSPIGFWRGVRRLGLPKRQVAAVGDQVFTDIVGANLCGIPASSSSRSNWKRASLPLALKRRLERWLKERRDHRLQRQKMGGMKMENPLFGPAGAVPPLRPKDIPPPWRRRPGSRPGD